MSGSAIFVERSQTLRYNFKLIPAIVAHDLSVLYLICRVSTSYGGGHQENWTEIVHLHCRFIMLISLVVSPSLASRYFNWRTIINSDGKTSRFVLDGTPQCHSRILCKYVAEKHLSTDKWSGSGAAAEAAGSLLVTMLAVYHSSNEHSTKPNSLVS